MRGTTVPTSVGSLQDLKAPGKCALTRTGSTAEPNVVLRPAQFQRHLQSIPIPPIAAIGLTGQLLAQPLQTFGRRIKFKGQFFFFRARTLHGAAF